MVYWRFRELALLTISLCGIAIFYAQIYAVTKKSISEFLQSELRISTAIAAKYRFNLANGILTRLIVLLNQDELIRNENNHQQLDLVLEEISTNNMFLDAYTDDKGNFIDPYVEQMFMGDFCALLPDAKIPGKNLSVECKKTTANGTLNLLEVNINNYELIKYLKGQLNHNNSYPACVSYYTYQNNYLAPPTFAIPYAYLTLYFKMKEDFENLVYVTKTQNEQKLIVQIIVILMLGLTCVWLLKWRVNRDSAFGKMMQLIPFVEILKNDYLKSYILRTYGSKVEILKRLK